jgi:hypothetical protein
MNAEASFRSFCGWIIAGLCVLPCSAGDRFFNGLFADAALTGQHGVSSKTATVAVSNISDNGNRQLGLRKTLAFGLPALADHIGVIVGVGSNEQMRRIDALRIIAPVKDGTAFGCFAINERIGEMTCVHAPSATFSITDDGSSGFQSATPNDAPGRRLLADAVKETINQRYNSPRHDDPLERFVVFRATSSLRCLFARFRFMECET